MPVVQLQLQLRLQVTINCLNAIFLLSRFTSSSHNSRSSQAPIRAKSGKFLADNSGIFCECQGSFCCHSTKATLKGWYDIITSFTGVFDGTMKSPRGKYVSLRSIPGDLTILSLLIHRRDAVECIKEGEHVPFHLSYFNFGALPIFTCSLAAWMDTNMNEKPRTLVLCFDGTGGKYNVDVSFRSSRKYVI